VDTELRYVSRLGAESSDDGWKDVLWDDCPEVDGGVLGT